MSTAVANERGGRSIQWLASWRHLPMAPVIFAAAFAARVWVVLGDGGLTGNFYYDPAVYYSAADALSHRRMPYHDYVLVHPPVIALVTLPFAVLGRLTTDRTGFIAANLGYTAMAAVNAVLVMLVARRFGLPRRAALAGAAFYALWTGAITAEFLIRLEPLGNFFLLLSLLAVAAARRTSVLRPAVVCGALLGVLLNVKIWWVVAAAVILGYLVLMDRSARRAGAALAALVVTCVLIDAPFYAVAGRRMFRAIFTAQLQRGGNAVDVHSRLDKLTGLSQLVGDRFNDDSIGSDVKLQLLAAAFCLLVVVSAVLAARTALGRAMGVLLVLEAVVFFTSQTWFYTYCDYLAVPLALLIAGAAMRAGWPRLVALALPGFAAVVTLATFANGGLHMVPPAPWAASLRASVAHVHCIVSDTPMTLIQLDALDRSFTGRCENWVDLTGVAHGGGADAADLTRPGQTNARYSADLCAYLSSGDAVILSTGSWRSLTPACLERIRRSPVIVRSGSQVVHRMR